MLPTGQIDRTKRSRRPGPVAIVAGGLFLVSVIFGYRELGAFLPRAEPLAERVAVLLRTDGGPSLLASLDSRLARDARLGSCRVTLLQLETAARAEPGDDRIRAGRVACLNIATSNASRAPLSSNDWFISSTLAQRAGETSRMQDYLAASYRSGPNEGWIAERRGPFAYSVETHLATSFRALIDRDFALMLQTERGTRALAKLYLTNEAIRERLVNIAVGLGQTRQQRFLSLVTEGGA